MYCPSPLFDSHFHIIDPRFPLVANQGYLPEAFTTDDYLKRMKAFNLQGGAVVSGSFQAFDQSYLIAALQQFGEGFVGVTQIPATITDDELASLHQAGIRAVRFNLRRGGSEDIRELENMAQRVYQQFQWHVELYVDARELKQLTPLVKRLPAVSLDHLGLSKDGLPYLKALLENNVKVKACGFGRVDFDVSKVLPMLYQINPHALMFGSDLPSTRAPRAFEDADIQLIMDALPETTAYHAVLYENGQRFYARP